MGKYLTPDAILNFHDEQFEEIAVPEWGGGIVRLRGLTAAERDQYEASLIEGKGKNQRMNYTNVRAKLLVRCIVDEQGKRLFTDAQIAALGNKSAAALERLFDKARHLSALTEEDVEELSGNSESDQSADSPSA